MLGFENWVEKGTTTPFQEGWGGPDYCLKFRGENVALIVVV